MPFQRGDVFAVTSSGVQEYTPTGQLVQTIPGTTGARVICFDPSGQHLILPGIGLFDSSGNLLPSNWASAPIGGIDCVADRFGNVYADGPSSPLTKYDLRGNALQSFNLVGGIQFAMDLAPDGCTMYISVWAGPPNFSGPFNVCTNTQDDTFSFQLFDDLRVLPNRQVLRLYDYYAQRLDTSGQPVQDYYPPDAPEQTGSLRTLSLDPDGTSFWMCCDRNTTSTSNPSEIWRFDISTGQILAEWPLSASAIAIYPGTPLSPPPPPPPPPPPSPPPPPGSGGGGTGGSNSGSTPSPGGSSPAAGGAGSGGSNSGSTPSPGESAPAAGGAGTSGPSPSQIGTLLSAILAPRGKTADIKQLLAHGGYSFTWTAPTAGRLTISWYQVPNGAHVSRKQTPVLVGTVSRSFSRGSKVTLKIVLTRAGNQLLRSVRRVKLTAKASFAPRGKPAATVLKTFILTR